MSERAGRSVPVVVLTGGIASGKTLVSDRLEELGVPVIDTDVLAREVVEPGTDGLQAVIDAFGSDLLLDNGSLDRKALGRRVFADDGARTTLESILHPLIEQSARRRIQGLKRAPYCLLVVPLFVESGLFTDADLVVTIDVPEQIQRERLRHREALSNDAVDRILSAQASRRERLARADIVLTNTGKPQALRQKAEQLHQELLGRFQEDADDL